MATLLGVVYYGGTNEPCTGLYISLILFFPFVRGEVLPPNSSPPHLIVFFHPPLQSPVFFSQSSSSPAFLASLLTQSSHLSLGLTRLLLPSSRNSLAIFGSLSSAILSTCHAHCSLLLAVKLLCTPVYVDSNPRK